MKKRFNINVLMSFLSKKGALLLGLFAGAMIALLSSIVVHAVELDSSVYCYLIAKGNNHLYASSAIDYEFYVSGADYLERFAGYYDSNGYLVIKSLTKENIRNHMECDDWTEPREDASYTASGAYPDNVYVGVYIFDSESIATDYLNGLVDASCAVNYAEIASQHQNYNNDIPKIEYLRFDSLSSAGTVVAFGMSDVSYINDFVESTGNELNYLCKVYPIYSTTAGSSALSSYGNNIADKVGKWLKNFFGLDTDTYYDDKFYDNGLMKIETFPTVHSYKETDPFIIGDCFEYNEVFDINNVQINIRPASYSNLTFVGAYCEVCPYYMGDSMEIGNKVFYQQFIDGDMQATVGLSNNIKSDYDNNGEEIKTNMGNSSLVIGDDYILSSDNVLDYIHTGFGLSGTGGYIALMQAFFLGVPAWLWVLVATALGTSITLIVFKVLRGM